MRKPVVLPLSYPPDYLTEWSRKDCRMLTSSKACDYLKDILTAKVFRRGGGRRFFGEAYVAANIKHRSGYYGSFKWLTNPRFSSDRPFPEGSTRIFQEELRTALWKHFGRRQLEKLRERARDLENTTGVRPVAPDLWLVDRQGNHRFIEVKLPGDRVRPSQLAGMALIKSCLCTKARLSVEVADLQPERTSADVAKASKLWANTVHSRQRPVR
jgi:hypothetical protein